MAKLPSDMARLVSIELFGHVLVHILLDKPDLASEY